MGVLNCLFFCEQRSVKADKSSLEPIDQGSNQQSGDFSPLSCSNQERRHKVWVSCIVDHEGGSTEPRGAPITTIGEIQTKLHSLTNFYQTNAGLHGGLITDIEGGSELSKNVTQKKIGDDDNDTIVVNKQALTFAQFAKTFGDIVPEHFAIDNFVVARVSGLIKGFLNLP